MISKEISAKFGYMELNPFRELLHAVGLLHTSRKIDSTYALDQVKKVLNQKYDSFCVAIIYDSTRDGRDVSIGKVFKGGKAGFSNKIKSRLPRSRVEFDDSINATLIEAAGGNKGLSILKRSIALSSMSCHFNMILIYDVSRNDYKLIKKLNRKRCDADNT